MPVLILMNIIWAASYTVMKWGMEYLAPMHLLFLRLSIAFVILFLFSLGSIPKLSPRLLFRCALIGGIIAVSHSFSVIGIDRSFAVDGAILYAMEPIVAIVFARILLKERMDKLSMVALALALVGFMILSDVGNSKLLSNLTFVGNSIMLVGIFADGLFSPVAKPALDNCPSRVVMMLALFFAVIFISPLAFSTPLKADSFSWQSAASVLYLSVVCTGIGWTVWLFYLKRFPVNVIALTVFIQPIIGPFISHFTIGEQIGARVWFGGGVILIAVILVTLKRKNTKEELIAEAVSH